MRTHVTIEPSITTDIEFPMSDMKPGQICTVTRDARMMNSIYKGQVLMRTLAQDRFEAMILSNFKTGNCFTRDELDLFSAIYVKPVPVGTRIIFEVRD